MKTYYKPQQESRTVTTGAENRVGNLSLTRNKAYLSLYQKIVAGELPPGSAISEVLLSKELGISRTPIREALGQLAAEGLIEQSPNRKAVVARLGRQDIVELYELREALERYSVGKAACRPLRDSERKSLESLNQSIYSIKELLTASGKPALDHEMMSRFTAYDLGFHTLLVRLAANGRILKVVNDTRILLRIFTMRREGHNGPLLEKIYREHAAVLQAVVEQDSQRAMRLISEHIQRSLEERLELYDRWEIETSLHTNVPFFFDVRPLMESVAGLAANNGNAAPPQAGVPAVNADAGED